MTFETIESDLQLARASGHVTLGDLRVAIVHDWLTGYAGSERVLEQILLLFPQAELFSLVDHVPPTERRFLQGRPVNTSFLQGVPFSAQLFRKLLWLFPAAIESFDLSQFELVISSSHAVAKGVITGPDQLHVCYCHSPIRYAWDRQHEYLRQAGLEKGILSIYARAALHYLRLWDVRTAAGVNHFVANSSFIARRIAKVYAREAAVIHPPVAVNEFHINHEKSDCYVTASRLAPYKRVDLIVRAFAKMPNRRLIVIGDGPEMEKCRRLAASNVELMGYQPDDVLREAVGKARAFVFAAEEDFGISVVEAHAAGTPVICFGRGGVLDSVVNGQTGIYFYQQSVQSIIEAVENFEALEFPLNALTIQAQAQQFSTENFRDRFLSYVAARWEEHSLDLKASEKDQIKRLAMRA